MNKYEFLKETFPDIEPIENKIFVKNRLLEILQFLKNSPELYYDSLFSIIAIDYLEYVELIYILDSTYFNESINLCIRVKDKTATVTHIYPSAYFDECEIYDLFGIEFQNNKNLKRLFMPISWKDFPLRKNYQMNDERLNWNEL